MKHSFSQVLRLYHPKADSTGSMLAMSILPAANSEPGGVVISLAKQVENGFDVANANTFVLALPEIGKVIQVFRGECETINNGNGIVSRKHELAFNIRHVIEPVAGYLFGILKGTSEILFTMTPAEAIGVCIALEGSLPRIAFGDPESAMCIDEQAEGEEIDKDNGDSRATSSVGSDDTSEATVSYTNYEGVKCYPSDPSKSVFRETADDAVVTDTVRKPTDGEFEAAYKKVLTHFGFDYIKEISEAFSRLKDGNPVTSEELRYGRDILGSDDPVVKYAESIVR